jgi:hypothetical protein
MIRNINFSSKNDDVITLLKFANENEVETLFDTDFNRLHYIKNFRKQSLTISTDNTEYINENLYDVVRYSPESSNSLITNLDLSSVPAINYNNMYVETIKIISDITTVKHNLDAEYLIVNAWAKEENDFYRNYDCSIKICNSNEIEILLDSFVSEIKIIIQKGDSNVSVLQNTGVSGLF